jgi:biopolymer transport protein ExbD
MTGSGLISLGSASDAPIAQFRAAMLLTAMTLLAAFLPILLCIPPLINQVSVDLRESPCSGPAARVYHRLEIEADGRILLDGRPRANLVELRMGLDIITLDPAAGVEMRPNPNLRYETFLEVLATAERAGAHLRVVGDGVMYVASGAERCWAI